MSDHDTDDDFSPKRRRIQYDSEEEENAELEEEERAARNIAYAGGSGDEDEEGEGEDLMENMEADYAPIAALDQYDGEMLDDREFRSMDAETRRRAEEEISARRGRDDALRDFLDGYGSEDDEARERRRNRLERAARDEDEEEEDVPEQPLNLETFDVSLREWIAQDRTRREIKRRFRVFLTTYKDKGTHPVHQERIRTMCRQNLASLEVSYVHLSNAQPVLGIWLADAPRDMLVIFDEVLFEVVCTYFPEYDNIHDEVHVRISDLPLADRLRDLRQYHIDQLIKVSGVVTRRTGVFPQLRMVKYDCMNCKHVIGPFQQSDDGRESRPSACPNCLESGPFRMNTQETVYRNFQKITLQESPGSVPPGRVPRYKDVILLADLIDRARPGQEVEITGVYRFVGSSARPEKTGFPVFSTVIEANHIQKREDLFSSLALTDEDRREILQLSRDPRIGKRIIASIAPSIYGHTHMKTAIALSLFGGCPKSVNGKHKIRGDINVLLLGDPGTAKSQVLKYCEKTAPRAVYTTGKGASAVGLTAGVHRDPITKEWTLEGGALVLADRGCCLIDEFDKMSEMDRTSIHEAMEQQSISVSKAGIVTSLQARCAVLAAANPIGGRYDASMTLTENVELTDPIIQRFDILCVLQDVVDPVADENLARFVVGSHRRSHPSEIAEEDDEDGDAGSTDGDDDSSSDGAVAQRPAEAEPGFALPQPILRKYIMYARNFVRPQLHSIDQDKLERLYAELRRESMSSGGVPIAVRHIESVMRMAEAHARMHLRDHVRDDDVDTAIRVMLESFIQAQKFSVRRSLARSFRRYLTHNRDYHELLLHALQALVRDVQSYQRLKYRGLREPDRIEVLCEDLEQRGRECNIYDLSDFYASETFKKHGFVLDEGRRMIVLQM